MDRRIVDSTGILRGNGMMTLIELCEAGLGIAALPDYPKEILNPNLKRLMSLPKSKENSLWILTHKDLVRSKRIRLTTEFFYQALKPYFS